MYAVLVAFCRNPKDLPRAEQSLDELSSLVATAGGKTVGTIIQTKDAPDPRTLIGKGKVAELSDFCHVNHVELVVFDEELSPSQIRNLEDAMPDYTSVIDRSMLILDIFAGRAVTNEGKIQVELAQLKYTAPRLMGKGKDLSRQGGGIGSRGPGESQLETDKRHLNERIRSLERRLAEMEKNRQNQRKARDRSGICRFAIVGYTNAGKSTLLNRLTGAGVLSEDKLFATLDATTRKYRLNNGKTVLLTDTVGFISRLPHHLVEAFKSTLEEAATADVLLIVIDSADPEQDNQLAVTEQVLSDLGAGEKPRLYIYNKCDKAGLFPCVQGNKILLSAEKGSGCDLLIGELEKMAENYRNG